MSTAPSTVAGRSATKHKQAAAPAKPVPGRSGGVPQRAHRRNVAAPPAAPRNPRRVSGPAGPARTGRSAGQAPPEIRIEDRRPKAKPAPKASARPATARAATARATAAPARPAARPQVTRPQAPRPQAPRTQPRRPQNAGSHAGRPQAPRFSVPAFHVPSLDPRTGVIALGAGIRSLPEHHILDRIVRGRAWIPMLAVMLVGIVFIQVEVLKYGTSVGRSMDLASQLQNQNQDLRAAVSSLSNPTRIEDISARRAAMQLPGPTDTHFVSSTTSVEKAIANITAPNATTFDANLATQQQNDAQNATAAGTTAGTPDAATAGTTGNTASGSTATQNSPATTSTPAATGSGAAATGAASTLSTVGTASSGSATAGTTPGAATAGTTPAAATAAQTTSASGGAGIAAGSTN